MPETPPTPLPAKLVVEGVSKWFRTKQIEVHALDNVSLTVADGEFVCLVAPSGCGESTLLDIIAGLTKADEGRVLADGQPVAGPGRHRLVIFQESALFPWLTTMDNVMFGLKLCPELDERERRRIAREHLKLVGLERFAQADVHELSGGTLLHATLARSLAPAPGILPMDEPCAALDALTREQLYGDLQRIWATKRKTIILVTHNVRRAACLGDRVILMSANPGCVREEFGIRLPRPRDINSPELAEYAQTITAALKGYIDVAVSE